MSKSAEEMATEITVAWLRAMGEGTSTASPASIANILIPERVATIYRTALAAILDKNEERSEQQAAAAEVLRNAKVY